MKNIQIKLIALLFVTLAFPRSGSSQDNNELRYEVTTIYPFISISKEKLNDAHTLTDLDVEANHLHHYYKSSWIKEYISVEVLTINEGEIKKALSKSDAFSQEQKDNMLMADAGTDISVKVQYIPDNTLTHKEMKELDFTFTVNPEKEATFPGGQQQLKQYLKENAIDKMKDGSFNNSDLAAIKFTVSEAGEIVDAHVFESVYQSSKNEKTYNLLLQTIQNMPRWTPAEYANGTRAKQEFVLTVGNMESCVINLLNIR